VRWGCSCRCSASWRSDSSRARTIVNGRHVSPDAFFAFAIPALGSYLALSAMMVALSWGTRRERPWVRPLMLTIAVLGVGVPLTLAYVSGVAFGRAWTGLGAALLMIVVLWWQLYYDDDILAYYAALRERARA
jgi:hypothetical protein